MTMRRVGPGGLKKTGASTDALSPATADTVPPSVVHGPLAKGGVVFNCGSNRTALRHMFDVGFRSLAAVSPTKPGPLIDTGVTCRLNFVFWLSVTSFGTE